MSYQRQVSRTLDDEHRVNLELLGHIEQAFARAPRAGNAGNADLTRLATLFPHAVVTDALVIQKYYEERYHTASTFIPYGCNVGREIGAGHDGA